jgi:hypothetical protein
MITGDVVAYDQVISTTCNLILEESDKLYKKEQWEKYLTCVESCFKINGSSHKTPSWATAQLYFRMGKSYNKMGNLEKAHEFYEKVESIKWAQIEGKNDNHYRAKSLQHRSQLMTASKNYQLAILYINKAIEITVSESYPGHHQKKIYHFYVTRFNIFLQLMISEPPSKSNRDTIAKWNQILLGDLSDVVWLCTDNVHLVHTCLKCIKEFNNGKMISIDLYDSKYTLEEVQIKNGLNKESCFISRCQYLMLFERHLMEKYYLCRQLSNHYYYLDHSSQNAVQWDCLIMEGYYSDKDVLTMGEKDKLCFYTLVCEVCCSLSEYYSNKNYSAYDKHIALEYLNEGLYILDKYKDIDKSNELFKDFLRKRASLSVGIGNDSINDLEDREKEQEKEKENKNKNKNVTEDFEDFYFDSVSVEKINNDNKNDHVTDDSKKPINPIHQSKKAENDVDVDVNDVDGRFKNMNSHVSFVKLSVFDMCDYLTSLGSAYLQYIETFTDNGIDGATFVQLNDYDLHELLQIENRLHRVRLLNDITRYNNDSKKLVANNNNNNININNNNNKKVSSSSSLIEKQKEVNKAENVDNNNTNNKENDDDEEKLCVICLDANKSMAFTPCGHLCCCKKCGMLETLKTCPICRITIKNRQTIFS